MPTDRPLERPYLQQPLPLLLIFSAFFGLTIPLSVLNYDRLSTALTTMESIALSPLVQIYVCALGLTHFFLTFTVYFQSGNLRYFASSIKNQIIFFAIPIGIFVFFDLYHALGIEERFVGFAVVFFAMIRFFDFVHFNRQNFGVHQLFKGKSGALFPVWMKKAEEWYFMSLVLLIFQTFVAPDHHIPLRSPLFWTNAAISAALFSAILYGYLTAVDKAAKPSQLAAPFGYLMMQSAAAGMAVYSTALYLFSLAIHYVEYHVLMAPRCFDSPLDSRSRVDRWFDRIRRHKLVFYLLLLGIAALAMGMVRSATAKENSAIPYRLLIHVFDGLFVFHYFLEAFIWKFGDPYFRKALGPLYFPQPAQAVTAVTQQPIDDNHPACLQESAS